MTDRVISYYINVPEDGLKHFRMESHSLIKEPLSDIILVMHSDTEVLWSSDSRSAGGSTRLGRERSPDPSAG